MEGYQSIVQQIQKILEKRINIFNFHKNFKAIKKIGKGNFANVYLAENVSEQKEYAVKAFQKETILKQQKGMQSLQNEIQIMRKLDHVNCIKMHQMYETHNSFYMILDMLNGGNLFDIIQTKSLSNVNVRNIMKGLLEGLKYIHSQNIMHRDIKPENIMFKTGDLQEDDLQLVDFGLSTFEYESDIIFLKCGTPGYVAPEIYDQKKEMPIVYDKRCDIFSIGIVLHILIFGFGPFKGSNYTDVYNQNKNCNIDFNSHIYEDIQEDVMLILQGMLKKNKEQRLRIDEVLQSPFFIHKQIFKKNNEEQVEVCQSDDMKPSNEIPSFKQQFQLSEQQEQEDQFDILIDDKKQDSDIMKQNHNVLPDVIIKSEEKVEIDSNEEPIKQKIRNSKNIQTFDHEYRIEDSDDQLEQHFNKLKDGNNDDQKDKSNRKVISDEYV